MAANPPKLILVNGFVAAGKTTIAKHYISEHPLALLIEGDELVVNVGGWLQHEADARKLVYALTQSMVRTALAAGHDVVLPYLVMDDATHVERFQEIAQEHRARFYNFFLQTSHETAIASALQRGAWGEADTDPITEADMPILESLYERMERALAHQTDTIPIPREHRTATETYRLLLDYIE